jgi:PAS domain S-box-containing protein
MDNSTNMHAGENDKNHDNSYFELFNTVSEAIYIQDEDGTFVDVNKGAINMYGYSHDEFIGKNPEFVSAPGKNDLLKVSNLIKQVASTGNPEQFEFWGQRKNGVIFPKEVICNKGKYFGKDVIITTARDISERKQAEKEIVLSEEKYRMLLELAVDAFFQGDADGNFIATNNKAMDITGYSREDLLKMNMKDLFSKEILKKNSLRYDLLNMGETVISERKIVRKDGSTISVEMNSKLMPDGSFQSFFRDITERKRAETIMRESEERYRSLFETSPSGIMLLDEAGIIIDANESIFKSNQYSREELIGNDVRILAVPEEISKVDENINRILAGQILESELTSRRKDGSHCTLILKEIAFVLPSGQRGILSVSNDITDRKRAEEALKLRVTHSQSLLNLSINLAFAKSYNEVLNVALEEVKTTIGYHNLWVYILSEDKDKLTMLTAAGLINDSVISEAGISTLSIKGDKMLEEIAEGKGIVVVENALTDNWTNKEIVTKLGNRTIVHVPMTLLDGNIGSVGTGTFGDEGVQIPSPPEKEYLTAMAGHIAVALNRIRLLSLRDKMEDEIKQQLRFVKALNEIANIIISTEDSAIVLEKTTNILGETLITDRCLIYDVSYSKNHLSALSEWLNPDYPDIYPSRGTYPIETFIGGITEMRQTRHYMVSHFDTMNPVVLNDGSGEILHHQMMIKSGLWYPFAFHEDGFYLLVQNQIHNRREWTNHEVDFLDSVSMHVSIAIEKIRMLEERKISETELQKSKDRLNRGELVSKTGNWELHLDTGTMLASEGAGKLYGIHVEKATIEEVQNIVLPEYRQLLDTAMLNLIGKREPYNVEFKIKKFGTNVIIDIKSIAEYDREKNIVFGVIQDITQHKRAEQIQKVLYNISGAVSTTNDIDSFMSLIRTELGTLLDTTNFYVAFYDEATDMLTSTFCMDENDNINTWSATNSLTGYVIKNNKPLLVKNDDLFKKNWLQEFYQTGSNSEVWLGVPLREDGKVTGAFVVQSYNDPNAYDEKDVEMLEFISDQISISIHRKKAEQAIKAAKEKAEESDKLKTAFLANMSHEIRTPMNGILGFAELLDDNTLSPERRREFTSIISNSSKQLLTVINDIIDISKIESGLLKISNVHFNLNKLMREVLTTFHNLNARAGKSHIKLVFENGFSDDNSNIFCDDMRISQVLNNLIGNALKFTNSGFVKFGYRQQNDLLLFFVQDTGKGIAGEKQQFIFERFRQVEESNTRRFGGTGLGLSISKGLVELMGGNIWVVSEENKGSTFYFTLPVKMQTITESPVREKLFVKLDAGFNGKTILVSEDIQSNFHMIQIMLEKTNAILLYAEDGKQAVDTCRNNENIDLVLMDIQMPVMNGYEAASEIRKLRPQLPIIALTAYAYEEDKIRCLDAGCSDFISKPIDRYELIALMSKFLIK